MDKIQYIVKVVDGQEIPLRIISVPVPFGRYANMRLRRFARSMPEFKAKYVGGKLTYELPDGSTIRLA